MSSACPSRLELAAFLDGRPPNAGSASMEAHLQQCAVCRQQLDALATGDCSDLSPFRDLANTTSPPKLHEAIQQLKAVDPRKTQIGAQNPALPHGTQLRYLGDYEILDELGRGGMGVVYRACQRSLQREVALKVILAGQLASEADVRRFHVEAEAAAKLDHPHIVPIYEIGEHEGHQFFSMKRVDGGNLAEQIVREKQAGRAPPFDVRSATRLVSSVARAVQYAHQRGILHRDLKPSNILLDRAGQPHVTDFGLAKMLEHDSSLTRSAAVMGTPNYMAPEQAAGKTREVTTSADVYSLGAILYELLAGHPPFDADTPMAILQRVVQAEPVSPAQFNPSVPRDLATICLKCLEKEPGRRYGSAELLADDLDRFLRGEPILARPVSPPERLWRWCKRKPALAATLIALHIVFAIGLAGVLWQWRRAELHVVRESRERQRAEAARLRAEIERVEMLFSQGRIEWPVAQLARLLRQHPTNRVLAARLSSTLGQRSFCLPTLPPLTHEKAITSARFSPDGQHVLTAAKDRTARLWNSETGLQMLAFAHEEEVTQAEFSPNGQWVLTASLDKTARLWNAQTGQPHPAGPLTHRGAVRGVAFSPDGQRFLTRSDTGVDAVVQMWRTDSAQPEGAPLRHAVAVVAAAFSPDGKRVITVGGRGRVQVWNVETGAAEGAPVSAEEIVGEGRTLWDVRFIPDGQQLLVNHALFFDWSTGRPASRQLALKGEDIFCAEFSPNGHALLTALPNRGARLWDLTTGQALSPRLDHDSFVDHVAFSPDGDKLVTCSRDSTARVWETRTGQPLTEPLHHANPVRYAQFSVDGRRLLTLTGGDSEWMAWIWDLRILQPLTLSLEHGEPVNSLAFSLDGAKLATGSADRQARVWDRQSGRPVTPPLVHEDRVNHVEFSPDGRHLATASTDGTAAVWDSTIGLLRTNLPHRGSVFMAQFSPDGGRLLTAASDGDAVVWDWPAGRRLLVLQHRDEVLGARFSPDGQRIVTASADQTARLWDGQTGKPLFKPLAHKRNVVNAAFTPDSQKLVTVSGDNTAQVWDVATGQALLNPVVHVGPVRNTSPHFSSDGRKVLTASGNGALIWDIVTGRQLTPPLTHLALVHSARFSPDDSLVATVSDDQTATLWDPINGVTACEPFQHSGPVQCVEFSPDGHWLATASQDGVARLWEVPHLSAAPPQWLPDLAEAMVGMRLNAAGLTEAISPEALIVLRRRLQALPPVDPHSAWVQWLFADSATRRLSPDATLTLPDYVESRLQLGTTASLREALLLCPTKTLARTRLAQRLLDCDPAEMPTALPEADWHIRYALSLAPGNAELLRIRETVAQKQQSAAAPIRQTGTTR